MISGASTSMSVSSSESRNGSRRTAGSGGEEVALKRGPWSAAEDKVLVEYVKRYGEGNWNAMRKNTGLLRCGKSCRLRWTNHLRPNLKKGSFTPEEERLIIELHSRLGNKWARMAAQIPGRTDNEIKNFWNTRIKRPLRDGLPLYPHSQKPRQASPSQSPTPPQSAVVRNQLLEPQYETTIPLFHSPFQSGFHSTARIFDQTSSSTLLQHTSPLPLPPPRHKRCCDSAAFSISIPYATLNDHPLVLSPHDILPHTPVSFNLSSIPMEMGEMLSPGSFSVANPELPSSQSQCSRIMKTVESCSGGFLSSDTRVLSDVTEEARAWANAPHNNFSNAKSKSEMNRPAPDLEVDTYHAPSLDAGIAHNTSPLSGINPFQEDQVKMSDFFLSTTHAPTPEANCGRSLNVGPLGYASDVQDDFGDNLGLDLHDIAALFPGNSMAELPEIY